jgi:hypothetical protein
MHCVDPNKNNLYYIYAVNIVIMMVAFFFMAGTVGVLLWR